MSLKVTLFSRTPLAAAPWELYKALKKYTDINVTLINQRNRYRDGRVFPYHLLYTTDNGAARDALVNSDLWHVHNYMFPGLSMLKRNQKVLAQFHSVPRIGDWKALMNFSDENYTIDQPLQKKEYGLVGLPNIIDPDEYYPIKREGRVKIAFAPSSRAPLGHMACKGYSQVRDILNQVAEIRDIEIVWIEGRSYEENLRMKQGSHILIDDVVTGNWHRTSLEGACFGCAVLNRINKLPFVFASLANLKEKLLWLIDSPESLEIIQERTRLWILQKWHAVDLIHKYVKAYEKILG